MTTPTSFQTAGRVIRMAFKDAGLIQDGDEPNGEQLADALMRLSDMINLWQTQGLKLWLMSDLSVTLVAGTGTYTLGPAGSTVMVKPMRVISAYFLNTSNVRTPLLPLSWDEYTRLSQTTTSGAINSYFVDKQQTQLAVSFWNVPDTTAATGTAHLIIQNQATDPVALTDNVGFPMEWAIALRWGLADEIATGQPQAIMDRCEKKAKAYREALEDWDVEDTPTRFQPDPRGLYATSGFR